MVIAHHGYLQQKCYLQKQLPQVILSCGFLLCIIQMRFRFVWFLVSTAMVYRSFYKICRFKSFTESMLDQHVFYTWAGLFAFFEMIIKKNFANYPREMLQFAVFSIITPISHSFYDLLLRN